MQSKIAERALLGIFTGAVLLSIYVALYWSAPQVAWASEHSAEQAVKAVCTKTPGCKAARTDIGVSAEARRPVYVAHLKLRPGTKPAAVTDAVRSAMQATLDQLPIPFRWMLDERSIAVEVTYHD